MPVLENPKHEAFAYGLAKGMKQVDAYVSAGYEANASSASRLAASPAIKARVEELQKAEFQAINKLLENPNRETAKTLREMGLTLEWCAYAYKKIYERALDNNQLAPANTAVANIQKLIEIQSAGTGEEDREPESLIKVSEVTGMLESLKGVIEAAKTAGDPSEIDDGLGPLDDTDISPGDFLMHIDLEENDDNA